MLITPPAQRRATDRYRARHRAAGLCVICPRPVAPGLTRCPRHAGVPQRQNFQWTAPRVQELIALWRDGWTAPMCAKHFGMSSRSLFEKVTRLRAQGFPLARRRARTAAVSSERNNAMKKPSKTNATQRLRAGILRGYTPPILDTCENCDALVPPRRLERWDMVATSARGLQRRDTMMVCLACARLPASILFGVEGGQYVNGHIDRKTG